jgi:teichuronic acid biosynthesis glycosyltransferase TuaC
MRVFMLSKRQYMGKDLLDDAYGRFYELPLELARLGHEVAGLCASYRRREEGEITVGGETAGVKWQARNVRVYSPLSLFHWIAAAEAAVRRFRPQIIWACSDSFHAIIGSYLQRRCRIPCVIDLYDNFESYAATRIPGVLPTFRAAVRQAAGLTCVSEALRRYVRDRYDARGACVVLENGVSAEFRPRDRTECRRRLGLPLTARIIGTAGAISRERGSEVLFEAFVRLAQDDPNLRLLLAGRLSKNAQIPSHERIVYLGQLPTAEVPWVIGAMDVAVVCNRRSVFGDYCFPQKLYEIIACGVPPLVARTQGVADLLERSPRHAYEPGSVLSLVAGIRGLFEDPGMPPIDPVSWSRHGARLSEFFEDVAADRRWA